MGNVIAFDTYAYVKRLRDAGMDELQAAIQAETLVSLVEERLATKRDVAEIHLKIKELELAIETARTELSREIEAARSDTQRGIELLRSELSREIEAARSDTQRETETVRSDLQREIELLRSETKLAIQELAARIETNKIELKWDIAESKADTIKWIVSLSLAQLGVLTGILFAILRILPAG